MERFNGLTEGFYNIMREYTFFLQKCVMHSKIKIFLVYHNFMKKIYSKLSKNETENIP